MTAVRSNRVTVKMTDFSLAAPQCSTQRLDVDDYVYVKLRKSVKTVAISSFRDFRHILQASMVSYEATRGINYFIELIPLELLYADDSFPNKAAQGPDNA